MSRMFSSIIYIKLQQGICFHLHDFHYVVYKVFNAEVCVAVRLDVADNSALKGMANILLLFWYFLKDLHTDMQIYK